MTLQQAIWIVPIDDTHCEEMRLTVYPEKPKERRYHGAFADQAKERERKPYDRRFYGEIKGIVPLEDKAMVESQGPIVDRSLEHPGYGDRAILLLRKDDSRRHRRGRQRRRAERRAERRPVSWSISTSVSKNIRWVKCLSQRKRSDRRATAAIGADMTTANDTSSALEQLGFIGLGNMGGAIALRLLRAGYPLTVLDLDDEKMQALKKNGAAVAATPKEIAERSTIVLASLQPGDVEKVTCGENGIAEANNEKLVFVDLSSTAPELAIKVSDSLRARGIEMLDCAAERRGYRRHQRQPDDFRRWQL